MILVREAVAADSAVIQNLYDSHKNEDEIIGLSYRETNWDIYLGRPHVFLQVATKDGLVVGFIHGYDMVNWGYVETLIVAKKTRNEGVGQALLTAFEQWGSNRWIASELCTSLTDARINDFAERLGYEDHGKSCWRVKFLLNALEKIEP